MGKELFEERKKFFKDYVIKEKRLPRYWEMTFADGQDLRQWFDSIVNTNQFDDYIKEIKEVLSLYGLKLLTDKENCYSRAYDLVLNGYELLSGSIRIHDAETQRKVFEAIGLSEEQAKAKFGFFLDAFKYGAPPHGGVGIGLERLIMILCDTDNIKDVVAFPKTASAYCLMTDAPNVVDEKQLKDLGIGLR